MFNVPGSFLNCGSLCIDLVETYEILRNSETMLRIGEEQHMFSEVKLSNIVKKVITCPNFVQKQRYEHLEL